ncbi:MAG TPA: TonB-dependent receptor [Acidobacteriaceae bacterium]|nr:TonB-dependent receptor [Acidobacteriaceae bacterium]
MQSGIWTAIVATACMIAPAPVVHAQQSAALTTSSSGSIAGVLRDPSGALISGARLELRATATSFRETQISDHLGHFSFVSVPAGNYELTVTASGFAGQTLHSLTVAAGKEISEDISLSIPVVAAEVQVEGQPSSIAASILQVQPSDSSQSHNSADMLADVPGVSLHGNGELATIPFLHGLGDERTKIVVDGMTISSACPNHMNPTLSYVAPPQAAQVTVLAGITPVSLGGDSLGGTIAVETPAPVFAEPGGRVHEEGTFSGFYRSNGDNWGGSLSEAIASEHFSLGYVGAFTTTGDYADGAGRKITSTYAQSTDHAVTLGAHGGHNYFVATGSFHHVPFEGFVNAFMDLTHNNATSLNLRYRRTFATGSLDAHFYWQNTTHEMNFLQDKLAVDGADASMPMNTHGRDLGYLVRYETALSARHTVRAGNELHRLRLDDWWPPVAGMAPMMGPNTFININNGRRTRLGTYAEIFSRWNPHWSTLFGARNDTVWSDAGDVHGYSAMYAADAAAFNAENHSRTDVNFDLTAMGRYDANRHAAFELGYARKNRSPNLYERYTWSTGMMAASMIGWFGDGNSYYGDISLKPETGNVVSGTMLLHGQTPRPWEVKLTPHLNYIHDYIDVNVASMPMMGSMMGTPLLRFANHDARIYGGDLSGLVTLWGNDSSGSGTLTASGAWLHGTRTDSGTPLYQMMPLNLRLAFDEHTKSFTAGFGSEMVDRKSHLDPNRMELRTPGFALVDVHAVYKTKYVQGGFRTDNLFNRFYELPLGGNNIDLYGATGSMTPVTGRGRSVSVNLIATF